MSYLPRLYAVLQEMGGAIPGMCVCMDVGVLYMWLGGGRGVIGRSSADSWGGWISDRPPTHHTYRTYLPLREITGQLKALLAVRIAEEFHGTEAEIGQLRQGLGT